MASWGSMEVLCLCVCVFGGTEGSSWSVMGLLIACEWYSEEGMVNRFNTETLNRLEKVSWGEAKPEIPVFLFYETDRKSLWILSKCQLI